MPQVNQSGVTAYIAQYYNLTQSASDASAITINVYETSTAEPIEVYKLAKVEIDILDTNLKERKTYQTQNADTSEQNKYALMNRAFASDEVKLGTPVFDTTGYLTVNLPADLINELPLGNVYANITLTYTDDSTVKLEELKIADVNVQPSDTPNLNLTADNVNRFTIPAPVYALTNNMSPAIGYCYVNDFDPTNVTQLKFNRFDFKNRENNYLRHLLNLSQPHLDLHIALTNVFNTSEYVFYKVKNSSIGDDYLKLDVNFSNQTIDKDKFNQNLNFGLFLELFNPADFDRNLQVSDTETTVSGVNQIKFIHGADVSSNTEGEVEVNINNDTDSAVTANTQVGGLKPNQQIPAQTNIQQLAELLAVEVKSPEIQPADAPRIDIQADQNLILEAKTTPTINLSFQVEPGQIYQPWSDTILEPKYAGALNSVDVDRTVFEDNDRNLTFFDHPITGDYDIETLTEENYEVALGKNQWEVQAQFKTGPALKNNQNQTITGAEFNQQVITNTLTIEGVWPIYVFNSSGGEQKRSELVSHNVQEVLISQPFDERPANGVRHGFALPKKMIGQRSVQIYKWNNISQQYQYLPTSFFKRESETKILHTKDVDYAKFTKKHVAQGGDIDNQPAYKIKFND